MTAPPADPRKQRYHHGDLRGALIAAARQLVNEHGADQFSLADACRGAGVSTAAPYKHFRDKNEVLEELIMIGMCELRDGREAALDLHGRSSVSGMIAMGKTYVAFARREPGLFRLMFGRNPELKSHPDVDLSCKDCFGGAITAVANYCTVNAVEQDASLIAVELWTFVHGVASLAIDGDYDKVAPGLDTDMLIESAVPRLLYA